MRLTGNWEKPTEDDYDGNVLRRTKRKPKGVVKVENTKTLADDVVPGVKIKAKRWFKFAHDWTDSDGKYEVNRGFRGNVRISVVFKNKMGFKIWPSMVSVSSSRYARNANKYGTDFIFSTNSVGWRWATVHNATIKYFDYCTQFGVTKPHSNLRIAVQPTRGDNSGTTPMLRKTWGWIGLKTHSNFITFLGKYSPISLIPNALWLVLRLSLPDIIIFLTDSQKTEKIYKLTFHELAHASHFKSVGSGYWVKYINYIISYGKSDNTNGDGTGKNSEVCGIGEMWGYYFASVCMDQEFPEPNTNHSPLDHLDPKEDWYNPGFLYDVDTIPDITTAEIFSCLKSKTQTFDQLINELENKTIYEKQIIQAWNNYTDWP